MKTNPRSTTRSLVLAALFLALAFVLPMITGHVPQVGNMLCPMHFPILLCGFVLGGPWGLAVGFIAPLVRSVLFGMPPMFPIAISMAFELAAYGLVSGVLWRKVKHTVPMMYASLVTAMVAGRLVWGAVRFVLAGLTGSSFPFSAFLSGALLTAVPGIVAQLVLIPLILVALQKAKVIDWTLSVTADAVPPLPKGRGFLLLAENTKKLPPRGKTSPAPGEDVTAGDKRGNLATPTALTERVKKGCCQELPQSRLRRASSLTEGA